MGLDRPSECPACGRLVLEAHMRIKRDGHLEAWTYSCGCPPLGRTWEDQAFDDGGNWHAGRLVSV